MYVDFQETDISKIYPNEYFGYNKITVERPLRLSSKFTKDAIANLRFDKAIENEMSWAYDHFGEELYTDFKKYKDVIEKHLLQSESKLGAPAKKKLLSEEGWKTSLQLFKDAEALAEKFGDKQFDDYNKFIELVPKAVKELKLKTDAKGINAIINAVSYKNEEAERVIKKVEKDGTLVYEPDTELRDSENVPLDQDIHEYFNREVLQHIPDAWIDETKTVKGYEISFTRYFYNYVPPRSLEEITAEIFNLERETEGILKDITSDVVEPQNL